MKTFLIAIAVALWSLLASAAPTTKSPEEVRLKIIGDRLVPTDSIGVPQYHKQQYKTIGNKICPVDSLGNVQHHKPCLLILKATRVHGNTFFVTHLPISKDDWDEAERLIKEANQEALSEMMRALAALNGMQ